MNDTVYLDHNATTPVLPAVIEAMSEALSVGGNGSSTHARGRAARRMIESARRDVAAMVGADPEGVTFTSGGTEANALAILGCGSSSVVVSAVEHDSVFQAVADPVVIPVDEQGQVDLGVLREILTAEVAPVLVSVMLANNETGVVQPIAAVRDLVREHGGLLHVDAVQAAGKLPLSFEELGADYLTISAHKFGGPQGVGALIRRLNEPLSPRQRGGGQESGLRAGTENLAGIVGMGCAARAIGCRLEAVGRVRALRDALQERIIEVSPASRIFSDGAPRLDNTCCVTLPHMDAEKQVMALDLAGVMVGAGAACSSGKITESRVLRAMGAGANEARWAIRISLGPENRDEDLDCFMEAWKSLVERSQERRRASEIRPATAA